MTDSPTPPPSDADASPAASSAGGLKGVGGHPIVLKFLAAVMLLAPLAGIAWHAWVYLAFDFDAVVAYGAGDWMKASAVAAFVLLVVNWFHYRHTRWTVDLVSRVLLYCWAVSMALLWVRVRNA
ncbi:MAG: hypothetical protein R6X20_15000 [Phycisphaerae bacterium]